MRREWPTPVPPIDPLFGPKGLSIFVLHNLAALDMLSNLHKFMGTRDEDPSRCMEEFIERLASSFIIDSGWFPTTLQGEPMSCIGTTQMATLRGECKYKGNS